MLKSDKKGCNLILVDKNAEVKKNEKLVTAKFEFSALATKILTLLIASIKETDTPQTIYKFNISDFLKMYEKGGNSLYKEIKEAIVEIMEKVIQVEDENKWRAYHIIRNPVIERGKGTIEIKFDEELFPLLVETRKRFLQYRIENILLLDSKYAIRLYEILKNSYNFKTRYSKQKEATETLDLSYLRERLFVPKSYKYGDIKRKILLVSKEQINKNTDISFEFEEIKEGRKVVKIEFIIFGKEEKDEKNITNFKTFRQDLIKQARQNKDDIFIYLGDEVYELKKGYLFKDGRILKNEIALEVWEKLYQNRDKLLIKTFEELIKEEEQEFKKSQNIYKKINELKEKYQTIKVTLKSGKKMECALSDIFYENEKIKIYLLGDVPLAPIIFNSIDEVEKFLKNSKK